MTNQTPEDRHQQELGQKIREARKKQDILDAKTAGKVNVETTSAGTALRASTDLVAALMVGGFLGYWIDHWLGTKPWGMIIFFFLGFGAGFLNIYRSQMGQTSKAGFKRPPEKTKNEEEK
jgi:ATP synthase protein I